MELCVTWILIATCFIFKGQYGMATNTTDYRSSSAVLSSSFPTSTSGMGETLPEIETGTTVTSATYITTTVMPIISSQIVVSSFSTRQFSSTNVESLTSTKMFNIFSESNGTESSTTSPNVPVYTSYFSSDVLNTTKIASVDTTDSPVSLTSAIQTSATTTLLLPSATHTFVPNSTYDSLSSSSKTSLSSTTVLETHVNFSSSSTYVKSSRTSISTTVNSDWPSSSSITYPSSTNLLTSVTDTFVPSSTYEENSMTSISTRKSSFLSSSLSISPSSVTTSIPEIDKTHATTSSMLTFSTMPFTNMTSSSKMTTLSSSIVTNYSTTRSPTSSETSSMASASSSVNTTPLTSSEITSQPSIHTTPVLSVTSPLSLSTIPSTTVKHSTAASTGSSNNESLRDQGQEGSSLSSGGKAALGIFIPLCFVLISGTILYFYIRKRRRGSWHISSISYKKWSHNNDAYADAENVMINQR